MLEIKNAGYDSARFFYGPSFVTLYKIKILFMKKISLLTLTVITGMAVFAQGDPRIGSPSQSHTPMRTPMAKKTTFGIDVGVNLATYDVKNSEFGNPSLAPEAENKTSFHAGVFVDIPIGGNFYLKPEIYYSGQGAKLSMQQATGTGNTTYNFEQDLGYIYLAPAAFSFKTPGGFMVETGPQVGYLISANLDGNVPPGYAGTGDFKDRFKKIDVLWSAGVGYMSRIGLGVHARYNYGLSNVLNAEDDANQMTGKMQNRVIQIGLAYHFGAHK